MSIQQRALQLHSILYNSKTRETDLVQFITSLTRDERLQVREKYNETFVSDEDLLNVLKKKLGGDFQDIVLKLFLTRAELGCQQIIRSLGLLTKNETAIYEIIFSSPKWLRDKIKTEYQLKQNKDMESDIVSAFSGKIKKVLPIFINGERRVNRNPNHSECEKLAYDLIAAKVENWIENEHIINDIFAGLSPHELVLTCRYFYKKTGNTVLDEVEKLPKNEKKFFNHLLFNVCNPAEMFAKKINESIKGLGTDTNLLERIIVSRYDIDMFLIKKYYQQLYKISAREDIEDDTSGAYKELVRALLWIQTKTDY